MLAELGLNLQLLAFCWGLGLATPQGLCKRWRNCLPCFRLGRGLEKPYAYSTNPRRECCPQDCSCAQMCVPCACHVLPTVGLGDPGSAPTLPRAHSNAACGSASRARGALAARIFIAIIGVGAGLCRRVHGPIVDGQSHQSPSQRCAPTEGLAWVEACCYKLLV